MRARQHYFLAAALMPFLFGTAVLAQGTGAIRGVVTDGQGMPIEGVRINASPFNGGPIGTLIQYVETDREGRFLIERLEWGKYGVFTVKEESGYPNTRYPLYSDDVFPTATVTPSLPVADLRIQLGPKAGALTGSVTDASNGAPLNAGFKLARAASPQKWLSTSTAPNFRVLIPSETEVLVEVSAPGFNTWSPRHPIRLQPGAELRLDISLEPSHDPALHPSRFLVPEGYVGWLVLEYSVKDAQPVPVENNLKIFKFSGSGALSTSSAGPEKGAEDEYLYYSSDGSTRGIPMDYRNGRAMIWGQYEGTRNGVLSQFGFFVGPEEQYKKFQNRKTHPGPIPAERGLGQ